MTETRSTLDALRTAVDEIGRVDGTDRADMLLGPALSLRDRPASAIFGNGGRDVIVGGRGSDRLDGGGGRPLTVTDVTSSSISPDDVAGPSGPIDADLLI